jgi:hypothetical protein
MAEGAPRLHVVSCTLATGGTLHARHRHAATLLQRGPVISTPSLHLITASALLYYCDHKGAAHSQGQGLHTVYTVSTFWHTPSASLVPVRSHPSSDIPVYCHGP